MNTTIMKIANNCWVNSYNDAAKMLGLAGSIHLGLVICEDVNEFFWYSGEKNKGNRFQALFRNVHPSITNMIERNHKIIIVSPGDYFVADGVMYYYDLDDLIIYQVMNYLNLNLVMTFAQTAGYQFRECCLAQMNRNAKSYYAWLLKLYTEEDDDDFNIYALPVFGDEAEELKAIQWLSSDIEPLKNGDEVIHGDELYRFEISPQRGTIELVQQNINFDFSSLFKKN